MKKIILPTIILFFLQQSFSQTTREFTENFETSTGIYGYVEILTKPATYGFASIKIQAKRVVVQGIKTNNGGFYGNELSEFGVVFPFDCNNCYFFAEGEAEMYLDALSGASNGYTAEAGFSKSGSIHLNDYTSHTAKFNENAVNRHNSLRKEKGYSVWEKSGYVSYIKISGVAGGDLGKVTSAVRQFKRKEKELIEEKRDAEIVLQENDSDNSSYSSKSSSNNDSDSRDTNNQTQTTTYKPKLTSQQLRDEANSMVVTKNYEQYYKNEKLKRAKELEELENLTKYNTYSSNSTSNTKYQQNVAIAQAGVAVLAEVFRVNPAAQRERENQRRMNYERREEIKNYVQTANEGLYKEEVMSDFSSNLAVKKNKKGWYGFVNKEGEWIIKPKYLFAKPFDNDKAEVTTKTGKKYYINSKGKKL